MNIKEHIEAGHYPTDDKGRALVPCEGPGGSIVTMTIYATDHGTSFPICGRHPACADAETWAPGGQNLGENGNLLPPPPREVKVTAWASVTPREGIRHLARSDASFYIHGSHYELREGDILVPLTGEYEEPWS